MDVIRQDEFQFWYPATLEKSSDGKMWISGIASTDDKDLQGEKIKQEGIELSYFMNRGFYNDDHDKATGSKVGIPTEARITSKGLWTRGYLLSTARAKSIYELAEALEKAGGDRKLGFSVEGKVMERDKHDPTVITKCWIKDIAITASPINPKSYMDISKSFAKDRDVAEIIVTGDDVEKGRGVLDGLESATKKPVEQSRVEEKDAEEAAKEALKEKPKPKEDMEKELSDVPVAKRAFKSLEGVEVIEGEDGSIIIKGLKKLKLAAAEPPDVVKIEEGEGDEKVQKKLDKTVVDAIGDVKQTKMHKKSEPDGDLEKGFTKVHEMGGEREIGDKKCPIHVTQYKHKKHPHHIIVTGKDGAYAVNHGVEDKDGKMEYIAGHLFYDDPVKGKKAQEGVDEHLKGYGIKHRFADKKALMGKAIVAANDESNSCEICKSAIQEGTLFVIQEGHSFCGEDCIQKALVTGYSFGKTDQMGGAALRVESLEGSQKHQEWGGDKLETNVKTVKFNIGRANGGTVKVTLREAIDYLVNHGMPEDMADRVLVLMVKNEGDLTKLVPERTKTKNG